MAKLTYETKRVLHWEALNRKIMEVYEVDGDDAQRAVFGDGAANGATALGDTTRREGLTRPVSTQAIERDKVNLSDILCDLAERGELDPGDYSVRLYW